MPESGELHDEPVTVPVATSTREFEGRVWDIRRETFEVGGSVVTRDFVDHPGAVAVLALDDEDRVLLIQQYRHPIRTRDWELPAGLLDIEGEDPLVGAQRELAEEVDLVASRWNVLVDMLPTPGGSNETIRVYLARGVSAANETFDRTEEEADIVARWVPLEEAVTAVLERRVQNSILSLAVLAASASQSRGWASLGAPDAAWPQHAHVRA